MGFFHYQLYQLVSWISEPSTVCCQRVGGLDFLAPYEVMDFWADLFGIFSRWKSSKVPGHKSTGVVVVMVVTGCYEPLTYECKHIYIHTICMVIITKPREARWCRLCGQDSYLQTGDDAIAVKSGWDCFGSLGHHKQNHGFL